MGGGFCSPVGIAPYHCLTPHQHRLPGVSSVPAGKRKVLAAAGKPQPLEVSRVPCSQAEYLNFPWRNFSNMWGRAGSPVWGTWCPGGDTSTWLSPAVGRGALSSASPAGWSQTPISRLTCSWPSLGAASLQHHCALPTSPPGSFPAAGRAPGCTGLEVAQLARPHRRPSS